MNIRMDDGLRHKINLLTVLWRTSQAGVIARLVDGYMETNPEVARVAETPAPYGTERVEVTKGEGSSEKTTA